MDPEVGQGEREAKLAKLSDLQNELNRALEALDNEAPNNQTELQQFHADIFRMQAELAGLKKDLGTEVK